MYHRSLRPSLRPGQATRLVWLALGSVALAELAGLAGPDAVVLDLQHGLWERSAMEAAIGIINQRVPVMVRVADHSMAAVANALDAGAAAVLVPLVETADDARRIVRAGRYPPVGRRSAGGVRPLMHGLAGMQLADRHLALGALLESTQAVENAHVICAVPGLDFVFIGTGDLGLSLGCASNEGLSAACARIRDAAHAHGLPCGVFTNDAEAARGALANGYDMVVVANDIELARHGFTQAMRSSGATENT